MNFEDGDVVPPEVLREKFQKSLRPTPNLFFRLIPKMEIFLGGD